MFKSRIQMVCNGLLIVCILFISINWFVVPSQPVLDKIVLVHSLGNGIFIYGARDNRGGATDGFVYRYYISKATSSDSDTLKVLESRHPFLITKNPDVLIKSVDGELHISTRGRVYEFSSYSLEDAGGVKINMVL